MVIAAASSDLEVLKVCEGKLDGDGRPANQMEETLAPPSDFIDQHWLSTLYKKTINYLNVFNLHPRLKYSINENNENNTLLITLTSVYIVIIHNHNRPQNWETKECPIGTLTVS